MTKLYVVGHKSPDTDSVVSAIVFSRFLNRGGFDYSPAIAGELNKETELVLSLFNEETPQKAEACGGDKFFLVDHNEILQSVSDLKEENISGVIDHHRLSGIKTEKPTYFRVEPLGSTSTLIFKLIKEKGESVSKEDAPLILCGIISDTFNLTSGTTTDEDKKAVEELCDIAGVNGKEVAEKMFEAKSDFSGRSLRDLVEGDLKEFEMGGKKVFIGVCEATSTKYFDGKEKDVLSVIAELKKEKECDAFFFGAVDILKKETKLYLVDEEEKFAAKEVFGLPSETDLAVLPGVSSRKSQMVPPLLKYYEKNI